VSVRTEATRRAIKQAREILRGVPISLDGSAFEFAQALVEKNDDAQRFREQIKIQRLYLKLVVTVLGRLVGSETLRSTPEEAALFKLMVEAENLLSKEQS
jgi:hypothetical protein